MLHELMQSKRNRVITLVVVLLIIALAFIIFLSGRQHSSDLTATDTLVRNTNFVQALNSSYSDKLRFFTGSTIAEVDIKNPTKTSTTLLADQPFGQVDKVFYSSDYNVLVVRSFYSSTVSFLSASNLLNTSGWYWFVVSKDGVRVLNAPKDTKSILDVYLTEKNTYVLAAGEDIANPRVSVTSTKGITSSEPNYTTLADAVSATSIVGASQSGVALRDYRLNLYLVNTAGAITKKTSAISPTYDEICDCIVYTPMKDTHPKSNTSNDEEDDHDHANQVSKERVIYNLKDGTTRSLLATNNYTYVSNNYLLSLPSNTQPSYIDTVNLTTGVSERVPLSSRELFNRSPVKDLVVLDQKLSLIAVVTNNNDLYTYQKNTKVKSPESLLPLIEEGGIYGFEYNIGHNTVTIHLERRNRSSIPKTLDELKRRCRCDVNQFKKMWIDPVGEENSVNH